jgi:hypothetical protein
MAKASVIIATTKARARFLAQTEKYLARQTFQDFEVIVNRSEIFTIGKKHNDSIELAKTDRIFIVDDDDFQANDRIEKQFRVLNTCKFCHSSHHYMWSTVQRMGTERTDPTNLIGANSAFHKSLWEKNRYNETMMRLSDVVFTAYHLTNARSEFLDMNDPSIFVYLIHGGNVSGVFEHGIDATAKIRWILGSDYDDIHNLRLI